MSLINDALKRAKLAQKKPAPPAVAPMRPAEPSRSVNAPRSLLLPILAAALLVFVGSILIIVALSRGFRAKSDDPAARHPAASSPKDDPAAATLPQAADVSRATVSSVPPVAFQATPTGSLQSSAVLPAGVTQSMITPESSNAAPVAQVSREPQLPRLQGILFNPTRPTAFLNGKSVIVGGRAGEYTVLSITKQAVTVARAGQTNVLTMEE